MLIHGKMNFENGLTMAKASNVSVNSGPSDAIILSIKEKTKQFMAIDVGKVITIAAETNKKAHSSPEM